MKLLEYIRALRADTWSTSNEGGFIRGGITTVAASTRKLSNVSLADTGVAGEAVAGILLARSAVRVTGPTSTGGFFSLRRDPLFV